VLHNDWRVAYGTGLYVDCPVLRSLTRIMVGAALGRLGPALNKFILPALRQESVGTARREGNSRFIRWLNTWSNPGTEPIWT